MNNNEYNVLVEKLAEEIIVDTAKRSEGNFGQPGSFPNMQQEPNGGVSGLERGGEESKSIGSKFLDFIKGTKKVEVGPNVVADASTGDYAVSETKVAYEELELVKTAAEKAFNEADNYVHSDSIKEAAYQIYEEAIEKEATLAYSESQMLKQAAEEAFSEADNYEDEEYIKQAAYEIFMEAEEVEKAASEYLAEKTIEEAAEAFDYSQMLKSAAEEAYAEADNYEDSEYIKQAAEEIYAEALSIEKEAGSFLVEIEKVAEEAAEEATKEEEDEEEEEDEKEEPKEDKEEASNSMAQKIIEEAAKKKMNNE